METTIKEKELRKYLNELRSQRDGDDSFELGYDSCIEAIESKFLGEY